MGWSVSVTDVRLQTCCPVPPERTSGAGTFMEHQNKPLTIQKDLYRSRLPADDLAAASAEPKSMLIADPKLAVYYSPADITQAFFVSS